MKLAIITLAAAAALVQATPVPGENIDGLPIPVHPVDLPIPADGGLLPNGEKSKYDPNPGDTIPHCAIPCIEAYIQKHSKCALDDYKCICHQKEVKDKDAVVCVINGCGFSMSKNVVYPAMIAFCKPYVEKK
ncbi:hypothetical protein PWT90_00170 [Aphanocladium album]|nr:hypothetical protein PWT90_00170 [Aphanocladium album]